jgi:regulator of protease activity HflC (stomatin/prohibitin superfamily)
MNEIFEPLDSGKTKSSREEELQQRIERRARLRERWRRRWVLTKRGTKVGLVLLVVGLFILIFWHRMIFSIDSGQVLVVYYRLFGGTSHNRIGHEGLHIIAPWDRAYIYDIRTQTVMIPMTVLSKNGVEVHMDAQLRFHPIQETIPYLHRFYGPQYIDNVIRPQLMQTVQEVIGQFMPDELYASQSGASAGRLLSRAQRLIGGVFLVVENVSLFNIKLPQQVQDAIQAKAQAEQEALAHVFKVQREELETQRKLIEARGVQQYQDVVKGIPSSMLVWKGIEATLELAKSPNAKIIVFGSKDTLPLLLGNVPDLLGRNQ